MTTIAPNCASNVGYTWPKKMERAKRSRIYIWANNITIQGTKPEEGRESTNLGLTSRKRRDQKDRGIERLREKRKKQEGEVHICATSTENKLSIQHT